jgi:hypothetical protein
MRTLSQSSRALRAAILVSTALTVMAAEDEVVRSVSRDYSEQIQPLLKHYCLGCHSTEKHKGDLDLERFTSLNEVLKHPKIWERLVEQISLGEMPPKEKPQPNAAERQRLLAWVETALDEAAKAHAGDPGPVVLRRLDNAEYTFTVRDLTGVESLNPAKEFPADSAAGEGFMNTGNSLVMSPALLTKYFDAGKEIASHAVLLPDGIRFSPSNLRRDWTEEILTQLRAFYARFTDPAGAESLDWTQGRMDELDKKQGVGLPLEKYFAASIELRTERKDVETMARERGLSAKYLASLMRILSGNEPSTVLDILRSHWRAAKPADAASLAAEVTQWQKVLWKFNRVGHLGKVGSAKAWMEPNPLTTKQEVLLKLVAPTNGDDVVIHLVADDAGDGNTNDFVVWQEPRILMPGRPKLLLREVQDFTHALMARRTNVFTTAEKCLTAAAEACATTNPPDLVTLSHRNGVDTDILAAWLDYLGIGSSIALELDHFTNQIHKVSGYDFVNGWGSTDTPMLVANSSEHLVRIPGLMRAHCVTVHPSAELNAAVGWKSPLAGTIRVEARMIPAQPYCGNGITWSLELRRGGSRQRLATGTAQGGSEVKAGPIEKVEVQKGDLVSLLIGPRDGKPSCDLTDLQFMITSGSKGEHDWSLTRDVSPDVLAGNPHADRFGNEGIWHFYTEAVSQSESDPVIPAGSLMLAKWQSAERPEQKLRLAQEVQHLLNSGPPAEKDSPDAKLYQELSSLAGPLLGGARSIRTRHQEKVQRASAKSQRFVASAVTGWGIEPTAFGRHPNGSRIDAGSLCVQAPAIIKIRLPSDLVAGADFATTGVLHPETGREGSVQFQVLTSKPVDVARLQPGASTIQNKNRTRTAPGRSILPNAPIVIAEGSAASKRLEASFDEFRRWFPAALCYTKIVPVDEIITLTLFHREDEPLARLMLDDTEKAQLDRMWNELHYVSHDALTLVDVFEQFMQYAAESTDYDPKIFGPMRKPINDRAAALRELLTHTEPKHLEAVIEFAGRAYRRPLTVGEKDELRGLYAKLRAEDLPHDEAIHLTLARVFVAPAFLYRFEKAAAGAEPGPVSDWELANRLSYFLWSSLPDTELSQVAEAGKLRNPDVLAAQAQRMLGDARVRRLATEFACAWLHIHDFESLDEKSERHFPGFAGLRGPMYEESILFFTDVFKSDASVLSIFDTDHTFVNERLAKHYGIPGVIGENWRRVDGVKKFGRGGILGLGTTLAKQSGASRTSPILRGNWVAEVILGDKLPRPPKDVPRLPEDEATESLTVRQLTEKHTSDPRCSGCHVHIDGYGYALEAYDAIGRARTHDLAGRPIDTHAKLFDGTQVEGADALIDYLVTRKRDVVVRQFCRKLLGYALGRGVQLSDKPLLTAMQQKLRDHDYRFSIAVETIVRSKQFREIRGKEMASED